MGNVHDICVSSDFIWDATAFLAGVFIGLSLWAAWLIVRSTYRTR